MQENSTNEQISGLLRVKTMRGSCYGAPSLTTELLFGADENEVLVEFFDGFKRQSVAIERAAGERFLTKIFTIIEQTEIFADLRHVETRYHAEIVWENLTFNENRRAGEFKAFSDEWFIDQIETEIEHAATAEIAARYREILERKPHRRALEIYAAAREFSRKYLR